MNFGYKDTTKRNILSFCLVLALLLTVFFEPNLVLADTGIDGDRTLAPGSTILNRYAPVDAISGNIITVTDIAALNDTVDDHYTNDSLSAGDLILIYQAQGASFTSTADDETYGEFSYGQAGAYEFAVVESVTGSDITVSSANTPPYSCSGITKSYNTATGNVQVVRVPQYTNLTIPNGATVTAAPWDGETGGVIALHVRYDLVVDGTIDASGLGFRGGTPPTQTSLTYGITLHRSTASEEGGEKGESILGNQEDYDEQGRFGRGAPANGGGGGNAHNSGGGGGANGLSSGAWSTGQGFVAVNDIYAAAWDLDDQVDSGSDLVPAYFQNGAGGGRGGYSFSDAYEDPTIIGIDNIAWNDPFGDRRRQVGGLGGRPLNNDPNTRLFFGGGGGSGDGNNASASPGGNGGGLVILIAQNTTGSGNISANGETASDTVNTFDDGAGGGGGGGTIIMKTTSLSNNTITVSANGGKGGSQPSVVLPGPPEVFFPQEAMGPGGGGGGGYVAVASGSGGLANSTVDGGENGITLSEAMNGGESSTTPTFPPNGATQGYSGSLNLTFNSASAFSFPGCQAPTAVTLQAFSVAQNPGLPLAAVTLIILAGALFTWTRRPHHSSSQ